jgi:hypothetical protein
VPVVRAQTETDVAFLGANFTRQVGQDNETFRYYELAGAAHSTVHEDIEVIPGGILGPDPVLLEDICLNPSNTLADGPVFGKYVYNAIWKNFERRVEGGVPMPFGTPIELDVFLQIVRDVAGNAQGGIRVPDINVPTASYNPPRNFGKPPCDFVTTFPPSCDPTGGLGGLACFLSGSAIPFDQETLVDLYPTHQDYVDAVDADARRLSDEGFLLNRDRKEIVDRAEDAAIP